jgi:hypothetical protein
MRLVNHTLTGVAIGLTASQPLVALAAGITSHFVLDAIPHWGTKHSDFNDPIGRKWALVDCTTSLGIAMAAALIWPGALLTLVPATLGAVLPDLHYIPYYLMKKKFWGGIIKFHAFIQTERPWGLISELIWLLVVLSVIKTYL